MHRLITEGWEKKKSQHTIRKRRYECNRWVRTVQVIHDWHLDSQATKGRPAVYYHLQVIHQPRNCSYLKKGTPMTHELDFRLQWMNYLTQCLKITEKVSFNIASEASYVYILVGQKFIKTPKNGQFWRLFEMRHFWWFSTTVTFFSCFSDPKSFWWFFWWLQPQCVFWPTFWYFWSWLFQRGRITTKVEKSSW